MTARRAALGFVTVLLVAAAFLVGCASFPPAPAAPPPSPSASGPKRPLPGNPVLPGWYADPEGVVFDPRPGQDPYWIYPTFSAPYDDQLHFDAFSSNDLVTWTKHPRVLERSAISWARRAMWAPSVIEHRGRFFFFFAANDIQNDREHGGIGVAVPTGAGHHSVMRVPVNRGGQEYFIVYHRRPLGETDRNHRVVCIDRLEFDEHGRIRPVRMSGGPANAEPARAVP